MKVKTKCAFRLSIFLCTTLLIFTNYSSLELYLLNLDVIVALQNHNNHLKGVVGNVRQAISIVNEKHRRYLDEIEAFKSNYSEELQATKRLSGYCSVLCAFLSINSLYFPSHVHVIYTNAFFLTKHDVPFYLDN